MKMATSNPGFTVNVKYGPGRTLSIQVDPSWDVERLKEEISKVKNIPKEEVRILFQGREMHNSMTIQVGSVWNLSLNSNDPLDLHYTFEA